MVASRIVIYIYIYIYIYILCFVCGSQSRCSRANAGQRLKIVGLVGGGWRHAAKFGSAFARLFILLYEQQTKNTPKNIPLL